MQDKSCSGYGDLYEQLMAISEEAIASAHYETAYHALTAALHYAHDIGDEQRLAQVEQTAKAQQDLIDTRAPEHRMSSLSTKKHHASNLYDMLARQASAQILLVQHKQRRANAKQLPWLDDNHKDDS